MSRAKRKLSCTQIYHVIMRGNNKQTLFEDDEDFSYFKQRLNYYKQKCSCDIFAYCLMDNHVHLLVKSGPNGISDFVKRLSNSYVYWFNNKYERIGHLFQGRFKSEPVETTSYFLTVIRYIHQNPVKANITKNCSDYAYSSYNEYLRKGTIINRSLCLSLMNLKEFICFHNTPNNDTCLTSYNKTIWRMKDKDAISYIRNVLPQLNLSHFSSLAKENRDHFIRLFRKRGMSISQISRLTGISAAIVAHA